MKRKKKLFGNLKKGSFTRYCRRKGFKKVTSKCIRMGLKSKNRKTRRRANFARNARKFKH